MKRMRDGSYRYTKLEENYWAANGEKVYKVLKHKDPTITYEESKETFFGSVKELQDNADKVNAKYKNKANAIKKISYSVMTREENFERLQTDTMESLFKGRRNEFKEYLGMSRKQKFDPKDFLKTEEGWEYTYGDKSILFKRSRDNSEDYEVIYA